MKQEHKLYILENKERMSVEEMARHLNIRERAISKFLKMKNVKENRASISDGLDAAVEKRNLILSIVMIVLAVGMVYANSLNGQFIWDDKQLIQDNPIIKNGWGVLGDIFTQSLRASSDGSTTSFRPLQTFTYLFDYSFWRVNVFGYHLTNVLFHALAAVSIFWFIKILLRDTLVSFLTAFLFALHPVHTEAVAYISGRADPMVVFFMILSFCLYLRSSSRQTLPGIGFLVLSYLCALLSRENGLVFPVLVLFYHFVFKKPIAAKSFIAIIVTSLVYTVWRGIVFKGTISDMPLETTLWQRTPGMFVALANYVRLLFIPYGLHMEYGGLLFHWNEPRIYVGMFLFLAILFLLYKKKEDKLFFFSVGWFLIAIFPLSNIYALNAYMAEHWLYMPSIGFFLLVANFIARSYRNNNYRLYAVMLLIGLTGYYGGMTVYQNYFWTNPIEFYKRLIKFNPESARPLTNLVSEYVKAGQEEDFIPLLERAMKIDPTNEVIYNNLGIAYNNAGESRKALEVYEKSIELNPDYGLAYYNAGIIYIDDIKDENKGLILLKKAVEKDSALFQAYHRMGLIYLGRGDKSEALTMLEKAVEVNPDAWMVYRSLGYYYSLEDNKDKAIENYTKAVEMNPQYTDAYGDLAVMYYKKGQMSRAAQYYNKAASMGYQNANLAQALKAYQR